MALIDTGPARWRPSPRLQRFSWALFDWAHQPYFTLVGAFLFKPYFASTYLGDPVRGQALIGLVGGSAAAVIAILSPAFGGALDRGGHAKRWIVVLSVLFAAACCGLWFAEPGRTDRLPLVMACMIGAAILAELMITANNAMMSHLTTAQGVGRLSGGAVALGFVGGLAALFVYLLLFNVMNPPLFGLDKQTYEPQRVVGAFCAVWFALFVTPMLLWTPERPARPKVKGASLRSIVRLLRQRPVLTRFLLGRMLLGDGLSAAGVFAGVLATGLFDWGTAELATYAVLLMTMSGLAAWLAGQADDRWGPKAIVMLCVTGLCIAVAGVGLVSADRLAFVFPITPPTTGDGFLATTGERIFMSLALLIGLSAGPLYGSLRSWLVRLSPADESGRWFGLFSFSSKATAFAAPLIIGGLTAWLGDLRVTIPVVLAFLLAGLICLRRVPEGVGAP